MGQTDNLLMNIDEIDTKKLDYKYLDSSITKYEMTEDETKLLIHQLIQNKPQKIQEISVAAGDTTQYILNNMPENSELFSVDISKGYYHDNSKKQDILPKSYAMRKHEKTGRHISDTSIDCIENSREPQAQETPPTSHTLQGISPGKNPDAE